MRNRYALIAILVGVPLGWITFAIIAADDGVAAGAVTGIATGLFTGGLTAGYAAWRDRAWARWGIALCAQYEAEGLVHHGQARIGRSVGIDLALVLVWAWHFVEGRGIDGWLVLTNERLVFHSRDGDRRVVEIALCDIAGVRRGASILANTIEMRLRNQRSLEIRVHARDELLGTFAGIKDITVVR